MKWSTTLGSWTRREAVLASCLVAATAIGSLAAWLNIPWLVGFAAAFGVLAAVARVVIAVKRARIERKDERAALARGLRVPVTRIDETNPILIGVERATQTILGGNELPDYLPRTVDKELGEALVSALDGTGPWIVLVAGGSKVGKSRALYEALLHLAPDSHIVAPVNNEALMRELTPGEGASIRKDHAVLWLDDVEPFISDGMTIQALNGWRTGASGRIVAGTYGGKGSESIAGSAAGNYATVAADLLQHASEVYMQATTGDELGRLRSQLSDRELAEVERHGLAAYLVAGPALERKLKTGRHEPGAEVCLEGVAVVQAAIDWVRSGRVDPIRSEELRRLWPGYLSPGLAATDDGFGLAIEWALRPVAGTIALLNRTVVGYRTFDYIVRLVGDDPATHLPSDESWSAAIETADDAQALAVAATAFVGGRLEEALTALARARESTVDEIAASAGYNVGFVLNALGRPEDAIAAYDDLIARFGDDALPALRGLVARALSSKAFILGMLGRLEEEIAAYDELVARSGDDATLAVREQVANGLFNKGVVLGKLDRRAEAITTYDELFADFGEDRESALRGRAINGLLNKAAKLCDLDRREEAIATYEEIIGRYGDDTELAMRELVARALVNKGGRLWELDLPDAALDAQDELLAGFGDDSEPVLRAALAMGLFNKGFGLERIDRFAEAIAAYDELITRFGNDAAPALREAVAKALNRKGGGLATIDGHAQAIAAYDELIVRFGDDVELTVREQVANGLHDKGLSLGKLDRPEDEIAAYDELVARFGDDAELTVREPVASGLYNKGVVLGKLDRSAEAIAAYDELIMRFGDDTAPALREQVAKALLNKGYRLAKLERFDEEIAAYGELIARFDGDTELLELVDRARKVRLGLLKE